VFSCVRQDRRFRITCLAADLQGYWCRITFTSLAVQTWPKPKSRLAKLRFLTHLRLDGTGCDSTLAPLVNRITKFRLCSVPKFGRSRRTPSQGPANRLFWVATAFQASHWVLDSNATHYWSYQNLSASSPVAPKAPLFVSKSQHGTSHPPERCFERGRGFPCTDLYFGEVGTDRPPFSKCIAPHGPAP